MSTEALFSCGGCRGWQDADCGLRTRFRAQITDAGQRKAFAYLLARFVRSYHFLTCFFALPADI